MIPTEATGKKPLRILFLCTHNACRSQMAEGWAHALKSGVFEAFSAGLEPLGVDPRAAQIMAEAGVDISGQRSKHVSEVPGPFDYAITLCDSAAANCPFIPGTRMIHHGFDDPPILARDAATEAERLAIYRRVRDEIRAFVESLPESLEQEAGESA
jgi:arsenate reductase